MVRSALALLLAVSLALIACGGEGGPSSDAPRPGESGEGGARERGARERGAEVADAPLVLFLGDSLTAGFGLGEEQAFPAVVGERLAEEGWTVRVVNAGVSGDTSAGGLSRLSWVLRQKPRVVVVALGANDGLRGLPLSQTEVNLRRIVEGSRQAGAEVILAGMLIPPNYGRDYTQAFAELYLRLEAELDIPRIPFLLAGVAAEPELNLADGIHPNAEGQRRVAETVLPFVIEALEKGR